MSSRMASLLLLCLLAVPVISNTGFIFSGTFICRNPERFDVEITAYEHDTLTKNDILFVESIKSAKSPLHYNFTTSDNHDGPLDKTFELEFKIVHTCNSQDFYHGMLEFTTEVGEVPVDDQLHYVNVKNMDLTNRGDKVYVGPFPTSN